MSVTRIIENICGDMCGYRRSPIRRCVSANAARTQQEIADQSDALFQRRVYDAIGRFPLYAQKFHAFRGSLLVPGTTVHAADCPIWNREDQRELFASLQQPPLRGAIVHSTGGSTGVPTRFYMTRESYEWRTAVSERGYSWAGADSGHRSFYIWGSPVKPMPLYKRLKVGLHHACQRRVYFDSFNFDDGRKRACCHAINRFRPVALVGYAGNLVALALYVRAHPGVLAWRARTLVTAAEGLHPGQRELLQHTLADEVYLSYGSREFMLIGMECREHRGYHIASDNLYVEVVDGNGSPCAPGMAGRILITDLHNTANPFIRYEIGDIGAQAADPCPCGLPFPLLERVEGRIQEFLYTVNGDRLTALFIPHLMKEYSWVRGYQAIQFGKGRVTMSVLADVEVTSVMLIPMIEALKAKLGATCEVNVVGVQELIKSSSGKVPLVIRRDEGCA